MSHFQVNAVRPTMFYIISTVLLCAFGWALSQGLVHLGFSFDFPYKKHIAIALFLLGGACGVFAILKNSNRSERPWATTRAQVNAFFVLFLIITFCAVILAK